MTEESENRTWIDVEELVRRLDHWSSAWHLKRSNQKPDDILYSKIFELHRKNFSLWHLESRSRKEGPSDRELVLMKRKINEDNRRRHQCIELVDTVLARNLEEMGVVPAADAVLHTESPGPIIDRLSVFSLRRFHLERMLERAEENAPDREFLQKRLETTCESMRLLKNAFTAMRDDVLAGRRAFFITHELKVYKNTESPA